MKTIITSTGNELSSQFDKRFGRAGWFCLYDEDTEETAIDVEEFMTRLTTREKEVAQRVAHGCTNKCIANKLDISERTVKAHLTSIFHKTGITDRVHLALILNSHKYDLPKTSID